MSCNDDKNEKQSYTSDKVGPPHTSTLSMPSQRATPRYSFTEGVSATINSPREVKHSSHSRGYHPSGSLHHSRGSGSSTFVSTFQDRSPQERNPGVRRRFVNRDERRQKRTDHPLPERIPGNHSSTLPFPLSSRSSSSIPSHFRSAESSLTTPPSILPESSVSCHRITPYISSQPQLPQHGEVTVRSGSSTTFSPNGGGGTILYFSSVQKRGGAFTTTDRETQWQLQRRNRAHQLSNEGRELVSNSKKCSQETACSSTSSFTQAQHLLCEADQSRNAKTVEEAALLACSYREKAVNRAASSTPSSLLGHSSVSSHIPDSTSSVKCQLECKKPFESRKRNRFHESSDSDEDTS